MPIYSIVLWVCEVCGDRYLPKSEEVTPYYDVTICHPTDEAWGYVGTIPDEKLACPKCLKLDSAQNKGKKQEAA